VPYAELSEEEKAKDEGVVEVARAAIKSVMDRYPPAREAYEQRRAGADTPNGIGIGGTQTVDSPEVRREQGRS
jgi:hypothetical protein